MAVLRAIVSDRDGIIHELVLRKRDQHTGYTWYYGNSALVITPVASPEEALRVLRQAISPTPDDRIQLINYEQSGDDRMPPRSQGS